MRTPCSTPMLAPCGLGSTPPALCSVAVRSAPAPALPCGQPNAIYLAARSWMMCRDWHSRGTVHSLPAHVSSLLNYTAVPSKRSYALSAQLQPSHSANHRLQLASQSYAPASTGRLRLHRFDVGC